MWDGLTRAGRMARYPEEWKRFLRDGKYCYRPPSGENIADVALRVESFLGTLARECPGQYVLIVTHSVVVQVFRRLVERMTEAELLEMDRDPEREVLNCSLTEYTGDDAGKLRLACFSRVCCPAELRLDATAG